MIGGEVGLFIQRHRAAKLGVRVAEIPRCTSCGGEVHVESYVVTRPEYGTCVECGARWEDEKPRGRLCPKCGYSLEEDELGVGGCVPGFVDDGDTSPLVVKEDELDA